MGAPCCSGIRKRSPLACPRNVLTDPLTFSVAAPLTLHPDILNRLNRPQPKRKAAPEFYVDPDPRQQMDDARHLAKYVFARQYGFASPFKFQTSRYEAFKIPNFSDRENEVKGTNCKTPKRLRDVVPMLEKLIWRHGKCGYKPLRDHACPSKVKSTPFALPPASRRSVSIRSKRSSRRMWTAVVFWFALVSCCCCLNHPTRSHTTDLGTYFRALDSLGAALAEIDNKRHFC
ncbi:hypothetical protein DFH06DRAFT_974446 [Mycena polygramma]|nr:hypothetical protein DFH06DRAFT_974446 [Mycena polygramma]